MSYTELGTPLGWAAPVPVKENVMRSLFMSGLLLYVGVQVFMDLGAVRK